MKRLLAIAATVASLGLSGCGFTPLYAQPGVVSNLASIDVVAPDGRTGFLLRQELDDALAKSRSGPAAYKMNLAISEARYPRGIRTDTRHPQITQQPARFGMEPGSLARLAGRSTRVPAPQLFEELRNDSRLEGKTRW